MKRTIALILAVLLVMTQFVGCGNTPAQPAGPGSNGPGASPSNAPAATPEKPIVLNVGVLDGWTGFTTKYIVDQGMDIANGLDIEYLVFSSGAPANEAMTSGDLDCAIIGGGATVPALANLNSKMIMETNNDTVGMSLIARPNLECNNVKGAVPNYPDILGNAETVRGLTFITSAGTLQYYLTLKYLESLGLTENDVNIVSMDANQGYQAFELGEGDVLACSNNYSFSLVNKGNVELASLTSLNCAATAQVVCSDAAFNNPEKVQALTIYVKLLAEVNDIMNNDTDLAAQSFFDWVKLNGGSPNMDTCRAIMETKPYYGVEATKTRELGKDFLDNFVEFYIMTNQLEASQKDTVASNIRTDILKAAGLK